MTNAPHPQRVTDRSCLLTVHDAAELIGQAVGKDRVTDRHVRDLVREKKLAGIKIGHLRRFTPDQVETYINTHLAIVEAPTPPVGAGLAA